MSMPEWLSIAYSYEGEREIVGPKHNPKILDFFKAVGHPEVKNDETSWCAAFVGYCLEEAGHVSTHSLLARSYLKWGKKVTKPQLGDVVVFWRGSPDSWQGHVAFYIKEDSSYVWVLGGNQSNAVNVSKYRKDQVLGYRRPATMAASRTVAGSVGAATGGTIMQTADALKETQQTLLGMPLEYLQYIGAFLALASLGLVLYARYDDIKKKGR